MTLRQYIEENGPDEAKKACACILEFYGAEELLAEVDDETVKLTALYKDGRAEVVIVVTKDELDKEAA